MVAVSDDEEEHLSDGESEEELEIPQFDVPDVVT